MTQEQKDLLIKDLCARLPYFTKVQIKNEIVVLDSICDDDGYHFNFIGDDREGVNIENIKPYLFPLSSMSEDLTNELYTNLTELELKAINDEIEHSAVSEFEIDFYHKHHIDYRGLIPMELANDATGLNIY